MIYMLRLLLSCNLIPVIATLLGEGGEERQEDVFKIKLQPANVQQLSSL